MSDRARVLVSRRIPDRAVEMLRQHFDVDVNHEDGALNPEQLKAHLKDKQGLRCQLQDQITGDLLNAAPQLKVSVNVAVGYDNVDLGAEFAPRETVLREADFIGGGKLCCRAGRPGAAEPGQPRCAQEVTSDK